MAGQFGWRSPSSRTEIAPKLASSRMGWRGSKTFPVSHFAHGGVAGADPQGLEPVAGWSPQTLPGSSPTGFGDNQGMPNEMSDWVNRNRSPVTPPTDAPLTPEQIANIQAAYASRGVQAPDNLGHTPAITGSPGAGTSGGLLTGDTPPIPVTNPSATPTDNTNVPGYMPPPNIQPIDDGGVGLNATPNGTWGSGNPLLMPAPTANQQSGNNPWPRFSEGGVVNALQEYLKRAGANWKGDGTTGPLSGYASNAGVHRA